MRYSWERHINLSSMSHPLRALSLLCPVLLVGFQEDPLSSRTFRPCKCGCSFYDGFLCSLHPESLQLGLWSPMLPFYFVLGRPHSVELRNFSWHARGCLGSNLGQPHASKCQICCAIALAQLPLLLMLLTSSMTLVSINLTYVVV